MSRKLSLAVVSCVALVAFTGLSSTAFALQEPECAKYNNQSAIFEFKIKTPNSPKAFEASNVRGVALACGSNVGFNNSGVGTLYRQATVQTANGVVITDPYAAGVQVGSYAGKATVNVLTAITLLPARFDRNIPVKLTVAARGTGRCPGTEVVCYFGDGGFIGNNENWAELNPLTGKYSLTIGEMSGLLGTSGLTKIDMTLCKNFGTTGSSCGSSSDTVVQFNGAPSNSGTALASIGGGSSNSRGCSNPNGNGIYTADAVLRNGTVIPPVDTCVPWRN